jgi:hypothetical protein
MGGRTVEATVCKTVLSRFDSYPMDRVKRGSAKGARLKASHVRRDRIFIFSM